MIALVERNLRLYFQNKATVFWSLFSPLLVLGLYRVIYSIQPGCQFSTSDDNAKSMATWWSIIRGRIDDFFHRFGNQGL
jgi:hypothetical protein